MKTNALLTSVNNSRFCLALRPLMFVLATGLGVGFATKSVGVGIAVGVAFAVVNGAFSRKME